MTPNTPKQPAIFLDRDGVIIENRPSYVRSWADVYIYPQALEALALAGRTAYKILLVTNQSAVGRGIISRETADDINRRLVDEIKSAGGRIEVVFMCPHRPEDNCACRKPQPGLLHQAADSLHLDLSRSLMIGDALTDLAAGQAAGVRQTILVKTGRGTTQATLPAVSTLQPFLIRETLSEALWEVL
jgi:D-glycero-D-manno-heptose 1,7-bisphosphate phosphatase